METITLDEIIEQRNRTHALYARADRIKRAAAEERAKLHDMRKRYLRQNGDQHDAT